MKYPDKLWNSNYFSTDDLHKLHDMEKSSLLGDDTKFLLRFVDKFFLMVSDLKDEIGELENEIEGLEKQLFDQLAASA